MLPAHQGLKPDQLQAMGIHLGLESCRQLLPWQGLVQGVVHAEFVAQLVGGLNGMRTHWHGRLPLCLCQHHVQPRQSHVGCAEQVIKPEAAHHHLRKMALSLAVDGLTAGLPQGMQPLRCAVGLAAAVQQKHKAASAVRPAPPGLR